VTIPPLQISNKVATQLSHAKRFSHVPHPRERPDFISEKVTADYADFADEFLQPSLRATSNCRTPHVVVFARRDATAFVKPPQDEQTRRYRKKT
jgi:hypothetical protein